MGHTISDLALCLMGEGPLSQSHGVSKCTGSSLRFVLPSLVQSWLDTQSRPTFMSLSLSWTSDSVPLHAHPETPTPNVTVLE